MTMNMVSSGISCFRLVGRYQYFGGTCCFHLQGRWVKCT